MFALRFLRLLFLCLLGGSQQRRRVKGQGDGLIGVLPRRADHLVAELPNRQGGFSPERGFRPLEWRHGLRDSCGPIPRCTEWGSVLIHDKRYRSDTLP